MKLTQHAEKRIQQRGFSKLVIDIVLSQGKEQPAAGGATKIFFGKKECQILIGELKKTIQIVEKARGSSLIIIGDKILTSYK